MDVRRDVDAKELASGAPAGLQRSRSTSTGLAGLRSLSRRVTHSKTDHDTSGNGSVMSLGAALSRTCSSVAYRHGGFPGGDDAADVVDCEGYSSSSGGGGGGQGFPPAGSTMMRRAFSVRAGGSNNRGYGRIHDTRDEDDEGLQRRAAGFETERKKSKKREAAGRRIVGACKRILGLTSNKV